MNLTQTVVLLPPNAMEVQLVDVDRDGQVEVVVTAKDSSTETPAPMSLYVYRLQGSTWSKVKQISMGQEAIFWEADHGLWAVDGAGVRDLWRNTRVVSVETWLNSLQHTSPKSANVVHDVNGDGEMEFLLYTQKGMALYTQQGTVLLQDTQPMDGSIRQYTKTGGIQLEVAQRATPVVLKDWNGDGILDVWWLQGKQAIISTGGETTVVDLPINVDPQYTSRPKKDLNWIRYEDINADGLTDMIWQYWVRGESWFGSTSEIGYALSNGATFEPKAHLSIQRAVLSVDIMDWDGDGDLDLWLLGTDLGLGSLSKALLTQQASTSIEVIPFAEDILKYSTAKTAVLNVSIPIGQDDAFDFTPMPDQDGDGYMDVLMMVEEEARLYTSSLLTWKQNSSVDLGQRGNLVRPTQLSLKEPVVVWSADQSKAIVLYAE